MAIRFIYFDLGNVLINFSVQRLLYQVSELTHKSEEEVKNAIFGDKKYQMLENGSLSSQAYFDQVCIELDCAINPDDFLEATNNIFWVNDSILPLVRHLAKIFFPRGILSNTGPQHWYYVQGTFDCITTLFRKHLVTSFESRYMKPQKEIYEIAFQEACREVTDLVPGEILFVDDLEENVAGAIEYGFAGLTYKDTDSLLAEFNRLGLPGPH
ncbi:MAG: hypothetical protein PHQ75_07410 [Thermoguttaceae bacterium]|nr:hypothetical protein [Thermoguttaceae bacterium]